MLAFIILVFFNFQAVAANWYTFPPEARPTKSTLPLKLATQTPEVPSEYRFNIQAWGDDQAQVPIMKQSIFGDMINNGKMAVGTEVEIKHITAYSYLFYYSIIPKGKPETEAVWICGYYLKATKL